MTYRELLELYSQGKLDEKQRIEIERELEKQEALSDYLFEHQAPPGMEDFFDGEPAFGASAAEEEPVVKDDSEEITKQINRSIRKAFIKTGTIAAAAAVILTLFIVFALPHIVSAFYYDPGKIICEDADVNKIEQFEQDMSVYSELSFPELGPQISTGTDSYGYGNYTYYLNAAFQVGEENVDVKNVMTGNIKRGTLICYNPDVLENYQTNYFCDDEQHAQALKKMNDTDLYYTYVKFDEYIPYEQFYADFVGDDELGTNESWVWCGVKTRDEDITEDHVKYGFFATPGRNEPKYEYDSEVYPSLAWEQSETMELDTEKKAKQHITSIFDYLLDNEKFNALSLDGQISPYVSEEEKAFVENEGLSIFGFAYVTDKEHIENMMKAEHVHHVAIDRVD